MLKYSKSFFMWLIIKLSIYLDENDGENEEGTYFVDQAGHYYFQAKGESQPVMTVLPGLTNSSGAEEPFVLNQDNEDEADEGEDVSINYYILRMDGCTYF